MSIRIAAAAVSALALVACAPSIQPQMKSATDALVAQAKGNHSEGAPSSYEPQPWKQGQWVLFRSVDKEGRPSVTRMSVVEEGAEGIWLEFDQQDYFGRTITKVLYSAQPQSAEQATDVVQKIITKRNDEAVQTMDYTDPNMAFMKGMAKSAMPAMVYPQSVENHPKEDVSVPAGTFQGAAKYPASVTFGPIQQRLTNWFHPAVPLNGAVKAVSDDGSYTYELLDYGSDGARSAL